MNGFRLVVSADPAERFLLDGVIVEHAELEEIAGWISAHLDEV